MKKKPQQEVLRKTFLANPDHYPPGDLPTASGDDLRRIAKTPAKDLEQPDVDTLLSEGERANRKIGWLKQSARDDAEERFASAMATTHMTTGWVKETVKDHVSERRQRKETGKRSGEARRIKASTTTRADIRRVLSIARSENVPRRKLTSFVATRLEREGRGRSTTWIRKIIKEISPKRN